jgi:hypothetical protein
MTGLGKKTFTAGDVLIAGDVNGYLMDQTVMNFASAAARSSAIPVPSTGMTSYRSDINQIESYDGSEWRGPTGLQLVKKQTIGTAVASVSVTDAFSATYENYKIVIDGGVSSADAYLQMNLGASTTAYFEFMLFGSFTSNTVLGANTNNGTKWIYTGDCVGSQGLYMNVDLLSPFLAKYTRYGTNTAYQSGTGSGVSSGIHRVATSYTGFTVAPNSGTLTGGTIYVYGYGK